MAMCGWLHPPAAFTLLCSAVSPGFPCLQTTLLLALQEPFNQKHLGFVDATDLLPGGIALRGQAPGEQAHYTFIRPQLEHLAGNDTRHIAKLHRLFAGPHVVIHLQTRCIHIQTHIGFLTAKDRGSLEQAWFHFATVRTAPSPLTLQEAIGHDFKSDLCRALHQDAAGMTMWVFH
uniref:Uncharacterized protein n=1 Tax=Alcaligenes faecalis TaxID=511 RepID=Q6WB86_ALCFA|nr:hypothetical protein [Alcaligenes faecalis subsp. faecalis NCIB 8687]